MLESSYVRPRAVARIRASWIGSEIECYVVWLAEQCYSRASVPPSCAGAGRLRRVGMGSRCQVHR